MSCRFIGGHAANRISCHLCAHRFRQSPPNVDLVPGETRNFLDSKRRKGLKRRSGKKDWVINARQKFTDIGKIDLGRRTLVAAPKTQALRDVPKTIFLLHVTRRLHSGLERQSPRRVSASVELPDVFANVLARDLMPEFEVGCQP